MTKGTHIDLIKNEDTNDYLTGRIDSVIDKLQKFKKDNCSVKRINIVIKNEVNNTDTEFTVEYFV